MKAGHAWRRVYRSGNECGWPGCNVVVERSLWACRDHWQRLPVEIRDRMMSQMKNRNEKGWRSKLFPFVEAEALAWIEANRN